MDETTFTITCQKAASAADFTVDIGRRYRGVTGVTVNWVTLMNTDAADLGCVLLEIDPLVFNAHGLYGLDSAGASYLGTGHGMLAIPTDGTSSASIVNVEFTHPETAACKGGVIPGAFKVKVFTADGAAASLNFININVTISHGGYA